MQFRIARTRRTCVTFATKANKSIRALLRMFIWLLIGIAEYIDYANKQKKMQKKITGAQ